MKELDKMVADKILDLVNYVLSKVINPDITVENVNQLTSEEIDKLKQEYGIEGIILDVDKTLRKELKDIPKCNKEWIESVKGKLKIIILSNGRDSEIKQYFEDNGMLYKRLFRI